MLIYSLLISPRLHYICNFIGYKLVGKPFTITDDKEKFTNFNGNKINYSPGKICDNEFWMQPHSLLFENEIKQQSIDCFEMEGYKVFFKTGGDFPFDIFAGAFYLLSRYEEYLPHTKDTYGRYAFENSLAFKEKFLDKPLINNWLQVFENKIKEKFPVLTTANPKFTFLPTYDIDEAYSYKGKGFFRTAGGVIKDVVKGRFDKIPLRRKVLHDTEADPFDSYEWMDNLHEHYKLQPYYFFLVPEKNGKVDRNILPSEKLLQKIIKSYSAKYKIGVHPSWQSGDEPSLIKKEINTIENISGLKVNSSRQHFIRFTLPQTFRYLLEAGITEDFSIGYGSINGFRASVASPFYWYDLKKEEQTNLLLYPFCYMDANSFFEQKFSPQQALKEMQHYYREVKNVNGILITLWHNTFLGADELFKGWKEVYEQFIKEVSA